MFTLKRVSYSLTDTGYRYIRQVPIYMGCLQYFAAETDVAVIFQRLKVIIFINTISDVVGKLSVWIISHVWGIMAGFSGNFSGNSCNMYALGPEKSRISDAFMTLRSKKLFK